MELEIEESRKNAEDMEVVVEKDGKETTKKIKANFKTTSQLPRHTRSNKVFDSLYDDTTPIALAQFGAGWVDQTDKKKECWTLTQDGPRINILGLYKSYEEATRKGYRMVKLIEKHGYKSYPMQAYPSRNWIVLRRYHPIHVKDDEVLATNIINYAKRFDRLTEIDFAEEIRQKDRPAPTPPPPKPKNLLEMHPHALKQLKQDTRALTKKTKQAIERLKKDTRLSRKQFMKAKNKLKKMERTKLKGMVAHIPSKGKDRKQNFVAVAWLTSPQYAHVDNTKYYGYEAPDKDEENPEDPVPDKIFTKEDFDEAMLVCILRTFETQEECDEFIDNKAKHDLDFCVVTNIEMYVHTPMDTVLTEEYERTVKKGYLTQLQQKVIVEREEIAKSGASIAQQKPEFVHELSKTKEGVVVSKESKATEHIRTELAKEKAKADEEFKQKQLEDVQEEEKGGGGAKEEDSQKEEEN